MKEQQFRQLLHDIAGEKITEMNVWDGIKSKTLVVDRHDHSGAFSRLLGVPRVVLVLILLLTVGATAYAVYQTQKLQSALSGIHEEGLVTRIGQSETIDGVTVTLNWVYADAEQIVVNYTTTVLDEAGHPRTIDSHRPPSTGYRLFNTEREMIIPTRSTIVTNGEREEIILASERALTPSEMEEEETAYLFELVFNERPLPGKKRMSGIMAVQNYRIPPESTVEPGELAIPTKGVGPFRFDFTLSLTPPIVIQLDQTVEEEGFSVTVKGLQIAPSKTQLQFCYAAERGEEWQPSLISLRTNEYTSVQIIYEREADGCVDASVDLFMPELPEQLVFQVEAFDDKELTEADWDRIVQRVRAKGGHIFVVNGVLQNWDYVFYDVLVELGYRIMGDWTITVDVETALQDD